ncbi:general secretion pathway protein I [Luteibacter sp. Sphag1AF]|uniref:type IV pilus modification PilV family protein n=1 Tax=Luteibacter sp. Sphag1AF TaxID=2587031 RepID=UPI00161FD7D3|nr:type II secretion system protein [Luteibacter sp. Sphag1AF]MBB3227619.1 general secretion pathway protein I [Luteibacter sp. Sphag1AF]
MPRRGQGGFSLLEVISAILLLSIAFGAVMHIAAASMHLTAQSTAINRAAMWADSAMESAGHTAPLVAGTTEGRFDATYRWRMVVTPVTDGGIKPSDLHLYRIDLEVIWRAGKANYTTLRVQDEPRPPAPVPPA